MIATCLTRCLSAFFTGTKTSSKFRARNLVLGAFLCTIRDVSRFVCADERLDDNSGGYGMNRKLVTYFSASGVTKRAAESFASIIGADLYEIKPAVPYTKEDLNWMDNKSRSSVEMKAPGLSSRPALADVDANISAYDVIFIGFPIWWYTAPTIVHTFLESYDFSGKIVVPFATSGGSPMGNISSTLQKVVPSASVRPGRMMNDRVSDQTLRDWANSFV